MNETEALSILAATPLLGSVKIRLLIHRFSTPQDALHATSESLTELPGFGPKLIQKWGWWKNDESWKKNLDLAESMRATLVPYTSSEYPKHLLSIPDFPLLLYVKGNLRSCDNNGIAIIGTRNATIYGKEQASKFSESIATAGYTVISGLARGIDTAAHQGALKRGRTIAVIGSGLANLYPSENKELAETIAENGAVISEYPMLTPPDRQHFPQRNRIVSGMSLGSLLIEAPIKSGAMLTMHKAKSHDRHLWAIPGRCDFGSFKGNHSLIKSGEAQLVENIEDVLSCFDSLFTLSPQHTPAKEQGPMLEQEEIAFLQSLPPEELNIDQIASLTKLPIMKLNVLLMSLVMKQVVKEYPGKVYKVAMNRELTHHSLVGV